MTRLDVEIMEWEELGLLKQSRKSTVCVVRKKDEEQVFIQKRLSGRHDIYLTLQGLKHPGLPELHEVTISDGETIIIEEYIEGQSLGSAALSEKQLSGIINELCAVLEFLHGEGIIHRDIKPSNILLAKDGHIRLIDFDAARMPRDELEQDTTLLGTRGYAPPEQYGFAQTDERSDIYALGVTLKQLLGDKAQKPRYKRVISKCTEPDRDKRYQSIRQVKKAFSHTGRSALYSFLAVFLMVFLGSIVFCLSAGWKAAGQEDGRYEHTGLPALPAPDNPHWDGETGIGLWGNVPESGTDEDMSYNWKLFRKDTRTSPDFAESQWARKGDMQGNHYDSEYFDMNFTSEFWKNGFYYFAVSAVGDGVNYTDSPYVLSDAFEYTGEAAPLLPAPTGLTWLAVEKSRGGVEYYAAWDNMDDYEDKDSFDVCVYDRTGAYVTNNIWTKENILLIGKGGVWINSKFLTDTDAPYRFTVRALTSRPNEYKSSDLPDPATEERFSPWLYF